MKNVTAVLVSLVVLVFIVSCGTSNDISGEYICIEHYSEEGVGELSLDFSNDGTVLMKPVNIKGDYSVEGNTVTIEMDQFDLTFTKDGNILTSSDGTVAYEKK